jgi:lipoic acid synthetase
MILGDLCTRSCKFCAIRTGRPRTPDRDEPARVAQAAKVMGLRYVVLTSVARDDLPDGGSDAFAQTIRALRDALPAARVEVLIPDFGGSDRDLDRVLAAEPDVLNHNLETVQRLQPVIRPQASYGRSLGVLERAARSEGKVVIKSGLMLGMGERRSEVLAALRDLLAVGCDLLTLGQYLAPSRNHRPVEEYIHPDAFARYAEDARALGFKEVASGPMVRSSYRAEALYAAARAARRPEEEARVSPAR